MKRLFAMLGAALLAAACSAPVRLPLYQARLDAHFANAPAQATAAQEARVQEPVAQFWRGFHDHTWRRFDDHYCPGTGSTRRGLSPPSEPPARDGPAPADRASESSHRIMHVRPAAAGVRALNLTGTKGGAVAWNVQASLIRSTRPANSSR